MILVDFGELFHLFRIAAVVRNAVMGIGHSDLPVGVVGALAAHHEGRDARGIGLESKQQHVEHDADVILKIARNALGGRDFRIGRLEALGLVDALFEVANAGEIFVKLFAIPCREVLLNRARILANKIEDGALLFLALFQMAGAFARRAGSEQSFEDQSWIGLGRDRRGRRTP